MSFISTTYNKYNSSSTLTKIATICRVEVIILFLFALSRIQTILDIKYMDEGLRRLINLIDYENGWTFYFITLGLLGSCLIIYGRISWTAWIFKMTSFICLIFKAGFLHWYISVYCIIGLIFYSSKTIKDQIIDFGKTHWVDRNLFIPFSILLIVLGETMTILIY